MKIGNVDTDKKVLIVAEIGNNHEGNFEVAQKLLQQAVACGVDAVKFQTFRTEHYVARSDESRFNRLKSFEFTADQFRSLEKLARSLNVLFLSTPFDLVSVDVLAPLVDAFKVSSGDFSFFPLIARVLKTKKPVIFSTGVSDVALIDGVAKFIRNEGVDPSKIAFLHCVSSYPVPPEQANLNSISFLKNHVPFTVGYSDHTIGVEAAVASVAAGARIVEKHFTLDKNYSSFRDHQLSADLADMNSQLAAATILEADPIFRANYYLNGMMLKYQVKATATVVYNTIMPIGCDGAISQVTWEVGDGRPVQTTASLNCEHSDWVAPYPVRRRAELLPPVLQQNVLVPLRPIPIAAF